MRTKVPVRTKAPMRDTVLTREITDDDWDAILELESGAYQESGLSEGRAALQSRHRASPETCFVLDSDRGVVGYALALPYPVCRFPDLGQREEAAFTSPNLHLHDLVVAEELRGKGLATVLLRRLTATALARTHRRISLVAVGDSEKFWSAHGYRPLPGVAVPSDYGANAVYMSKVL
ncbi:GNAT family N-acetyltransferase [Streptoalloteichus hindustanus]|uniref:Predicted N-acetyltransferase YhbS n=1 Tax=Streptoalloteichus hindustanus TaxID=2017 RepID=A0A1M5P0Z7_STRHI|nr:GNAT family N-acetyltransferase [Streptoalloteichus hindustanus]SHG95418.1 Predicted N-acetyltransferase YhbS [Streptoalloteichus hindustanus]